MKKTLLTLAFIGIAAIGTSSFAQEPKPMDGMGMNHGAMEALPKGDQGPSSQGFVAANNKMHRDMAITFSGNADVDFIKGMIAHHQGAIDMSKVELQYGKDAQARKMAEDIIKAQESEIAFMKEWLKKNGQ